MPNKNDLTAFKVESKNKLVQVQAPASKPEKLTEMVWVRFTPSEYARLKEKAGMIPLATYLKHLLMEHTDIL